MVTRTEGLNTA